MISYFAEAGDIKRTKESEVEVIKAKDKLKFENVSLKERIDIDEFFEAVKFAARVEHRNNFSGSLSHRSDQQIFMDALQGKLAEYAVRWYLTSNGVEVSKPDVNLYERGVWDVYDLSCVINDKTRLISVKSTKHYSDFLLLEKDAWNEKGEYKFGKDNQAIAYDYTVLVRIGCSDDCMDDLKNGFNKYNENKSDEELEELCGLVYKQKWSFDIPGFITQHELSKAIESQNANNEYIKGQNKITKQYNSKIGSTGIQVDNYYFQTGNMHFIDELTLSVDRVENTNNTSDNDIVHRMIAYYEQLVHATNHLSWKGVEAAYEWNTYKNFLNELVRDYFNSKTKHYDREKLSFDGESNIIDDYLVETNPNGAQRKAIYNALTQKVSFIQGPPGTGKSRTILNIMSCIVNGFNEKTVAIVSTNNAAVDVIVKNIEKYENTSGCDYIQKNRANLAKKFACLGNSDNKRKFAAENSAYKTGKYGSFDENQELYEYWDVETKAKDILGDGEDKYRAVSSTLHSLKFLFADKDYQYDYVIIDESSQVTPHIGLIALSCAKHVVIVGDEQQLPPVVNGSPEYEIEGEKIKLHVNYSYNNKKERIPQFVDLIKFCPNRETNDYPSILTTCKNVFSADLSPISDSNKYAKTNSVLLNRHYRCHPGLIGFSNSNFYNNRISVENDSESAEWKVPVRIKWYQGEYLEDSYVRVQSRVFENGHRKVYFSGQSKRNGKQELIFIKEELPVLLSELSEGTVESFAVISPYKSILSNIEKQISDKKNLENYDVSFGETFQESDFEEMNKNNVDDIKIGESINFLSVHKSQGKEFDVVYLLPCIDCVEDGRWPQGKNLINVALTRAKKEIRIITSTSSMSRMLRKSLDKDHNECHSLDKWYAHYSNFLDYVRIINFTDEEFDEWKGKDDIKYNESLISSYSSLRSELKGKTFEFPESSSKFGFHKNEIASVFDGLCLGSDKKDLVRKAKKQKEWFRNGLFKNKSFVKLVKENNLCIYEDVLFTNFLDDNDQFFFDSQRSEFDYQRINKNRGYYEIVSNYEKNIEALEKAGLDVTDKRKTLDILNDMQVNPYRFDFIICDDKGNIKIVIRLKYEYHRHMPNPDEPMDNEDSIGGDKYHIPDSWNRFKKDVHVHFNMVDVSTDGTDFNEIERVNKAIIKAIKGDCKKIYYKSIQERKLGKIEEGYSTKYQYNPIRKDWGKCFTKSN